MEQTPFNVDLIADKLAKLERLEEILTRNLTLDTVALEAMVIRNRSRCAMLHCCKALLAIRRDPGHVQGCECPICTDADAALIELQANDE